MYPLKEAAMKVQEETKTPHQPDERSIQRLRSRLRGQLVLPGDETYDTDRRVWNGMIDRRPGMIVRCAGPADVVDSVNFARDNQLKVAVRCGAHNVAGFATCDDGMVIDLSPMRGVRVDPKSRTAWVHGGAKWGDLDREAQVFGLAAPGGVVADTGAGGLALVGGMGWLTRKHGLTCDNLLAVDMVTADGEFRRASEQENPDLFWGIRGGGSNFGVVTAFQFKLHPVGPQVAAAIVLYPAEKAQAALRFYKEYTSKAPDEVGTIAEFATVPPAHIFPEKIHGKPVFLFAACYVGPVEEGVRQLQPLRDFAEPLADLSGAMPFIELQRFFDEDYPHGRLYYWRSIYLNNLEDEVSAVLAEHAARRPSPLSTLDVFTLGGAMARVDPDSAAFGRRDAPFMAAIEANWTEPQSSERNIAWARECVADLERFSYGGAYLNFPGFLEAGDELIKTTFGPNYDQLLALKKKYDPQNMFCFNHNLKPA
jgi:FAD/FMN-containing dehydrogenase